MAIDWGNLVRPSDFLSGPKALLTNGRKEWSPFTQLFFDNLSTFVGVLLALYGNFGPNGDFFVEPDHFNFIVYGKIASGVGVAMMFGNIYYSYQAARMTRISGRQFTAQPYGLNTPAAFAWVFNIMIPVYISEWAASGFSDDPEIKKNCFSKCYGVAIAANFVVGIINVSLGFLGPWFMKVLPPAALLVPIAGIGFTFLGIGQITANFGSPISGFLPILFVFIGWYANIKVFGFLPEAFSVIFIGTVIAWIDPVTRGQGGDFPTGLNAGIMNARDVVDGFVPSPISVVQLGEGFQLLGSYLGVVIPLAISASALTLMCLLSARNAGDPYPIHETMIADGLGTIVASIFGSPFGTVVYIGHPAHKRNGATTGYSWINGFIYFIMGMSGIFVIFQAVFPPVAIGPIILFVGLMICEDAVGTLPKRHWGVFFFGLFPSICDWVTTGALNVGINGTGLQQWGIYGLKYGAMLVSFFWCAILSYVVDRRWVTATCWCLGASLFSVFGIIHMHKAGVDQHLGVKGPFIPPGAVLGDQFCTQEQLADGTFKWPNDTNQCGTIQWRFVVAYLMMAAVTAIFGITQRMGFGPPPIDSKDDGMHFQKDWDDVSEIHQFQGVAGDHFNDDATIGHLKGQPSYDAEAPPKKVSDSDPTRSSNMSQPYPNLPYAGGQPYPVQPLQHKSFEAPYSNQMPQMMPPQGMMGSPSPMYRPY